MSSPTVTNDRTEFANCTIEASLASVLPPRIHPSLSLVSRPHFRAFYRTFHNVFHPLLLLKGRFTALGNISPKLILTYFIICIYILTKRSFIHITNISLNRSLRSPKIVFFFFFPEIFRQYAEFNNIFWAHWSNFPKIHSELLIASSP